MDDALARYSNQTERHSMSQNEWRI